MSELYTKRKRLIAVCGKGGTGKTALTAMMTRILLDSGVAGKLLLIDADPAMGLPGTLGVKVKRTMGQVREEIIKTARGTDKEKKAQLSNMLDYMVMEAIVETDRFTLLAMGRTETLGCFCPVNNLMRDAIESLSLSFDIIIIDGEAGVEQINRQVMRRVDTLIIVSDATSRGMQTAALIKEMVQNERVIQCENMGVVFNRMQGNEGLLKRAVGEMGLKVFGFVPQDENVARNDLLGKPILDLAATSPALAAVREIVMNSILK
ncbi:MAG: carbon monoxide dehydrogenase maturation protein [Chloroflexi bacterium]|nr:carbon monoxide dehydrogenase maturation protein [Chloroflexota bacterium]